MSSLYVDVRHRGEHGIGRYSKEVLARLPAGYLPFASRIGPGELLDAINPSRMRLARDAILYTPGYSSGFARCNQLLTLHDLIHLRGSGGARSAAHRVFYDKVVKPAVIKTRHVMTVSETSAAEIRTWLGDANAAIHITGNGCSQAFTAVGARFDFERPYILYVGDLKPHKNHEVAFAATKLLPDLGLIVVTGKHELARQLAVDAGIESRARVLTNISDEALARLYRGAEALLFPSILEGFGLPVAESLRCGTPVIFNAECASAAEICAGTQVAVESRNDPEAYATAVREVISGGPITIPPLEMYDWENVVNTVTNVLATITAELDR